MPMCESALHLQQGPRLASSPQAVPLALRPLAVGRILTIILLSAIIPWSSTGLHSNSVSSNVTIDFQVRQGRWKNSSSNSVNRFSPNKTSLIVSAERSVRDIDLKVGEQGIPNYTSSKSGSYPLDIAGEFVHSRQPRSAWPPGWAADIEHRERLQTHADSHILVLNAEQVRYMYRRKHRIFSFSIKETTWLEVVITPCSSNITWLFLGPGSGHFGSQRGEKRVFFTYTGADRRSFNAKLRPNVYNINITSLNGDYDSQVYIYLSTKTDIAPGSGLLYPSLPADAQVRAKAEGSTRSTRKLDVWWKPASISSYGLRLEYCLAISSIRNSRTHCAALAYAKGVERPKQARWGSREDYRRTYNARGFFARPVSASPKSIFYTCVGNKTSFTFKDDLGALRLRGGKKYYIDVFVKSLNKNTFSAYKGVSAKLKRKKLHSLNVGESRTFTLRPRKRPVVEIALNATFPKLILEVISCQGKIPIRIYRNDKRVRERRISRYKQIVIANERKGGGGKFLVKFPLSDRKRKPPRYSSSKRRRRQKKKQGVSYVTLSLPLQRSPIKTLPQNMTVSVLPYLSGCQNVTLEWRAAGPDYKYCIYYQRVGKTPEQSRETKDICRAAGEEPRRTSLAGCIEHHVTHPNRDTLTYNVQGLDAGTCYRFDVLVNRDGMASVPYDGVRVRTPKKCRKTKILTQSDFSCLRKNRRKSLPGKGRGRNG